MVLDQLIEEPAEETSAGRLYAVDILLPKIPFDPNNPSRSPVVQRLEEAYGKATAPSTTFFEMENLTTLVRVYYQTHRKQSYLTRIVLIGRDLSRARNRHLTDLKKEGDDAVRRKVAEANRTLEERADEEEPEPGIEPGGAALLKEMEEFRQPPPAEDVRISAPENLRTSRIVTEDDWREEPEGNLREAP